MNRYAIGIDVGGTKIAAGIVDQHGHVVSRYRTRAHSEREPEHVIAAIEEAGGGLTRVGPLLMDAAYESMCENVQPELCDTVRLAPSLLGDDIGIIGAAAEAFEMGG